MSFKLKEGTFTTVSLCIKGLNPYEQVLYLWLSHHANTNKTCFPSIRCLSEETGMGKMSVIRYLNQLVEKGFLTKSKRKMSSSQEYDSNLYTVLIKEVVSEVDNVVSEVDKGGLSDGQQVVSEVDTNKNQLNKNHLTKNTISEKKILIKNILSKQRKKMGMKNLSAAERDHRDEIDELKRRGKIFALV